MADPHSDIRERSSISLLPHMSSNLPHDALNKLANCHSRRNSMWVDNDVRGDAFHSPWHIFLSISHANSSFLTMSTTEFVTNLWYSN